MSEVRKPKLPASTAWRVRVPTTNGSMDTHRLSGDLAPGQYIPASHGLVWVTGALADVARAFPEALDITQLGPGVAVGDAAPPRSTLEDVATDLVRWADAARAALTSPNPGARDDTHALLRELDALLRRWPAALTSGG